MQAGERSIVEFVVPHGIDPEHAADVVQQALITWVGAEHAPGVYVKKVGGPNVGPTKNPFSGW
jgi:hypothetical protein